MKFDDPASECSEEDEQKMDLEQLAEEQAKGLQLERQFHVADQQCVTPNKSYILHLANNKSWNIVASASSERDVHLFDLTGGGLVTRKTVPVERFAEHIVGLRFAHNDDQVLYVATNDGTIHAIDLRQPGASAVSTFADEAAGDCAKRVVSFDLNANDRVLCAGTQPLGPDTFMMFFDTRRAGAPAMGVYSEAHSEDITQVAFHPTDPDRLASGSMDGLINVFDISQPNETEALQYCMNTESAVQRLQWHTCADQAGPANDNDGEREKRFDRDLLSCITCVDKLQLFDVTDSQKIYESKKGGFVGVHSTQAAGRIFALRSPLNASALLNGVTLQPKQANSLTMIANKCSNFPDNKQLIRCSLYNADSQQLITAGEAGLVTVWSPGQADDKPKATELKEKTKDRNRRHKAKPY